MADKAFMVNRTLCRYAGSYSFVLLAGGIPCETVDPVGQLLEIARNATMATSESVTDLAAAFLGHATTTRRELRCKVGVRCGKSSARRLSESIGRLAVSKRAECFKMVMEGQALSCPYGSKGRGVLHEILSTIKFRFSY